MINEKEYLRELAKRYNDIAHLDIMHERTALWYRHNALKGERPLIVMEMRTFEDDMLPPMRCESELAQRVERELLRHIVNHEKIGDDKVVPAYYTVPKEITVQLFGLNRVRTYAKDSSGRTLGYHDEHFIKDLEEDLQKLCNSNIFFDREKTKEHREYAEDTLGDILPVVEKNRSLEWLFGISQRIIELMGMEALMYAMIDSPDLVRRLYGFVCDDMIGVLRSMEEMGLLTGNNGNDYAGSGSYGFSDELHPEGNIVSSMLWGNMNSQETVSVSADMYGELVFPAYLRLSREFGLLYYGCCEPAHPLWDSYIKKLPGLRKVSVSPWCDEEYMGQALRGGNVIYSRKPSPNFLGLDNAFDEQAYTTHVEKTLRAAKGCHLEIIHRDIYTLSGDLDKRGRAVKILRELIDKMW